MITEVSPQQDQFIKKNASKSGFFNKKFVLAITAVLLIISVGLWLILSNQANVSKTAGRKSYPVYPVPTAISIPKIWQILFTFDNTSQLLTVKSIAVKNGTALSSPFTDSPYKLSILDKNKYILFQTDIRITQQILYNIVMPPDASNSAELFRQSQMVDTLVNVPYFNNADTIQITKNGNIILVIAPPRQLSFAVPNLVQKAYGAGLACSNVHIVFISDSYTDINKFHQDVANAKSTFNSKEPYASNSDIFDFRSIDNPSGNSLGCSKNGQLNVYCISTGTSLSKMQNLVSSNFPDLPLDQAHTKIVILVDAPPQPIGGGIVLGVANAIGGQYGVFQNRLYFESTATMEVLGHDVGLLYDRYLYPAGSGNGTLGTPGNPPQYKTNCSPSSQGENFWKAVGITQTYKGCTSQYLYAPAPLDCGSGGSKGTLMSAANCGGTQFDAVEQYWLKNNIIPQYKCAPTPTPTVQSPQSFVKQPSGTGSLPFAQPLKEYTCAPDPNCKSGTSSQQICTLRCTPKN